MSEIIVRKEDVSSFYSNKFRCTEGIGELERMGLLPLSITDTKPFRLFLGILGFRYADGCIYYQKRNKSFTFTLYFGEKRSADKLCKDVNKAWGIKLKPHQGRNSYCVYLPASIARLMICAGSPIGRKTSQAFELPNWLFKLPDKLKWGFIDGLFSGDGSAPRLKPCGTCSETLKLSLSSEESVVDRFANGFMTDIWKLLTSLGVKNSRPKIEWNSPRISKDGTVTYPVSIRILTQKKNMIKFLDDISYKYCIGASRKRKEASKGLKGMKLRKELRKFLNSNGSYLPSKELCVLLEKTYQRKLIERAAGEMSVSWGKYKGLANRLYEECERRGNLKLSSIKDNYLFWWRDSKKFIPLNFLLVLAKICNLNLKDIAKSVVKVKSLRNHNRHAVLFDPKDGCNI